MGLSSGDCRGQSLTVRTLWSSNSCVKALMYVWAHYPAAVPILFSVLSIGGDYTFKSSQITLLALFSVDSNKMCHYQSVHIKLRFRTMQALMEKSYVPASVPSCLLEITFVY